ncbi:hypothetical protein EVAR_82597_1 [Eumeta japonica]|uniref:Uncharacterized protein n=1 Tax=Eumeta variegata TaxID=151549 RepID=A0A4C1X4A6_EUMVA|nr:hypothetical protein EVAR_82597_1 [Eumeta japonica]
MVYLLIIVGAAPATSRQFHAPQPRCLPFSARTYSNNLQLFSVVRSSQREALCARRVTRALTKLHRQLRRQRERRVAAAAGVFLAYQVQRYATNVTIRQRKSASGPPTHFRREHRPCGGSLIYGAVGALPAKLVCVQGIIRLERAFEEQSRNTYKTLYDCWERKRMKASEQINDSASILAAGAIEAV